MLIQHILLLNLTRYARTRTFKARGRVREGIREGVREEGREILSRVDKNMSLTPGTFNGVMHIADHAFGNNSIIDHTPSP